MTVPQFSFHLANGNTWGQNAPANLSYEFDKYYFQAADSVGKDFSDSSGGFGFIAGLAAHYDAEFGFKAGLAIDSGTMNVDYNFSVDATGSTFQATDGQPPDAPYVVATGAVSGPTTIESQGGGLSQLDAVVAALLDAGVTGTIGVSFPALSSATHDFDVLNVGSVLSGVPQPIGGKIDLPELAKQELQYYNATNDYGLSFSIDLPQGADTSATQTESPDKTGLGILTATGTGADFAEGNLNFDTVLADLLGASKAADVLSGGGSFSAGTASVDVSWDLISASIDLNAAMSETHTFTPDVQASARGSNLQILDEPLSRAVDLAHMAAFNPTVTGGLGDHLVIDTPEGEGTFTVDMTYTALGHLTSTIGVHLGSDFMFKLLSGSIDASITGSSASADWAMVDEDVPLAGTVIPVYSHTDDYSLGTQQQTGLVAQFEKFRTTQGSGDDFALTTHQVDAEGNDDPNIIQGNALDNTIHGGGGDDHLYGEAGNDNLYGGDGNDVLDGGTGSDNLFGEGGNDVLMAPAAPNILYENGSPPIIDGGDGNDIVIGNTGFHSDLGQLGGLVILAGGNGSDRIVSGAADEELHGGPFDSIEQGGPSNDTFVFAPGCGHDDIWDFDSLQPDDNFSDSYTTIQFSNPRTLDANLRDTIDLRAFTNLHHIADLQLFTDGAGRIELKLDANDSISFDNVFTTQDFYQFVRPGIFLFAGGPSNFDFNSDGRSDVMFIQTGAQFDSDYQWQMNDRAISAQAGVDLFDKAFTVQVTGDFNGDGKADVLFENPATAGVWEWQLHGTNIHSQGAVDVGDPSYHILGTADFNGDGMSDVLWRNDTTGLLYQWQMNGTQDTGAAVGTLDPSVWHVVGAGDFTGDGKADILFHYQNAGNAADPANGALDIWQMDGSSVVATLGVERPDPSWQILGVGDFNGDGISDIAIRNVSATPDNGAVWVYLMAGTITTHPDTSKTADILAQGAAGIADPATWHVQTIGDLNGDGKSDVLFRNDAGYFYSWDMNGTTIQSEGLAGTEAGNWADPSLHVIGQHWDIA